MMAYTTNSGFTDKKRFWQLTRRSLRDVFGLLVERRRRKGKFILENLTIFHGNVRQRLEQVLF